MKSFLDRKKFLIFIIFAFLLIPPLTLKAELTNPTIPLQFTPNITIPGSVFRAHEALPIAPAGDLVMVKYIIALYNFFVGIAGIIAVFMIVFGGVLWLFSGGSSEKISKAKEIIVGSITGLVLVLGSYMILNTVNPNLTTFKVSFDALKTDAFPSVGGNEAKVCSFATFKSAGAEKEYLQCGYQFKESTNDKLKSEDGCLFAHCEDADDVCANDFVFPMCRGRLNGKEFFNQDVGQANLTFKNSAPVPINLSVQIYQARDNFGLPSLQCGYIYVFRQVTAQGEGIETQYAYSYYVGADCEGDGMDSYCFIDKNRRVSNVEVVDNGTWANGGIYGFIKIPFTPAKCYSGKCESVANSSAGCTGLNSIVYSLVQPSGSNIILVMQPNAASSMVALAQAKAALVSTMGWNNTIYVTSMFRNVAYQEYLHCDNPNNANTAGSSTHELGLAFDINYAASGINTAAKFIAFNQLAEQNHFHRSTCYDNGSALPSCNLGDDESWHFTYQGSYNGTRTGQGGICPNQ